MSRREPAVSVLLCVHNGTPWLKQAVTSILEQTLTDLELILVEDGSTDTTPALAQALAATDARIRLFTNPVNLGLTASLNRGLAAARGVYLARQDADDWSLPERLQKQTTFLATHPEVGILGCGSFRTNESDQTWQVDGLALTDAAIRWELLFQNPFFHTAIIIRRSVLQDSGLTYDPNLPVAQDYDLWTRLLRRTRGANLTEPLVGRRDHLQSRSTILRSEQQRIALAIAGGELARILGGREIPPQEVATLRQAIFYPSPFQPGATKVWKVVLEIWHAFAARSAVDPEELAAVREKLVERILGTIGLSQWLTAWQEGLLSALWHCAPGTVGRWLPTRIGHRLMSRKNQV